MAYLSPVLAPYSDYLPVGNILWVVNGILWIICVIIPLIFCAYCFFVGSKPRGLCLAIALLSPSRLLERGLKRIPQQCTARSVLTVLPGITIPTMAQPEDLRIPSGIMMTESTITRNLPKPLIK